MQKIEIKQMRDSGLSPVYEPVQLLQIALMSFALLLVAALLIYAFDIEFSWWGTLGYSALYLGLVAGAGLYLCVISASRVLLHRPSVFELNRMLVQMFRNIGWIGIVLLSLLAGVGEELLFRVFLQTAISDWLGPMVGVVLSSLLFGLAHYVSRLYFLITFIMGLCFGVLYYASESAALVMAMHFFYDLCAFTVVVKYPRLINQGI